MFRQIDPLAVEWIPVEGIAVATSKRGARYRQYRRGRPTPIAAILPWLRWKHKTVTLWATPTDARAALVDLEEHAHPKKIEGALISRLLNQAADKSQAYRASRIKQDGIAVAATAEGARALLDDLAWFSRASRSNSKPILDSVAATFLRHAIEAAEQSRRQYIRHCIEAAMQLHGPWIYRFARTVANPNETLTSCDTGLLRRMLTAAQSAGYRRELFYSTHTPPAVVDLAAASVPC